MGIEAALLTRPVWQGEHLEFLDARILSAPLQELRGCDSPVTEVSEIEHALKSAEPLWLILTSPASVDAFFFWLARNPNTRAALENQKAGLLKLAAVGEGTRDKIFQHPQAALFHGVKTPEIVVGEDAAHADAKHVRRLDRFDVHHFVQIIRDVRQRESKRVTHRLARTARVKTQHVKPLRQPLYQLGKTARAGRQPGHQHKPPRTLGARRDFIMNTCTSTLSKT